MSDYVERYSGSLAAAGVVEIALILAAYFSTPCRWLAVGLGGALAIPLGRWWKHLIDDLL